MKGVSWEGGGWKEGNIWDFMRFGNQKEPRDKRQRGRLPYTHCLAQRQALCTSSKVWLTESSESPQRRAVSTCLFYVVLRGPFWFGQGSGRILHGGLIWAITLVGTKIYFYRTEVTETPLTSTLANKSWFAAVHGLTSGAENHILSITHWFTLWRDQYDLVCVDAEGR